MNTYSEQEWASWEERIQEVLELFPSVELEVVCWGQNANGYELEGSEYMEKMYSSIMSSIGELDLEDTDGYREVYAVQPIKIKA